MQPQFSRVTILRNILIAFSVATVGMTRPATAEPENLQGIRFESRVIDPLAGEICYSVALADVDGDSKRDIVVATENAILWYRNPSWEKKVLIQNQTPRDNVCIAPLDIDGDQQIDFAVGAGWTKTGTLHWISRGAPGETWTVHDIGAEVSTHRMRFADVLGIGTVQLVISPLAASENRPGVRLTAFTIPKDPAKSRWIPTVLDGELNRMHNHWHCDLDGDQSVDTLTASREGVHVVRRTASGFSKTFLASGTAGDTPDASGSGEIKQGRLSHGKPFLVTVEPMHGSQVVVYQQQPESKKDAAWQRLVIDDGFRRGHAIWCADLDQDGADEIVFGSSDPSNKADYGPGISIYRADPAGIHWTRIVIDTGSVAVEDLVAEDLTDDGLPDIVAVGRATHNVKLFVNSGKPR